MDRMKLVYENFSKSSKKQINFISIGVGLSFPTFLSMEVRKIYHNGDDTITPVFLIANPAQESQWKENFK
jgi:hypothetical protein